MFNIKNVLFFLIIHSNFLHSQQPISLYRQLGFFPVKGLDYNEKDNSLWLSNRKGVYKIKSDYSLEKIPNLKVDLFTICENNIYSFTEDTMYVYSLENEGDFTLQEKRFIDDENQISINTLLIDNKKKPKKLYIGTNKGLYIFKIKNKKNEKEDEINKTKIVEPKPLQDNFLTDLEINALFIDSQEKVWIGTNDGLYIYDPKNKENNLKSPKKRKSQKDINLDVKIENESNLSKVKKIGRSNVEAIKSVEDSEVNQKVWILTVEKSIGTIWVSKLPSPKVREEKGETINKVAGNNSQGKSQNKLTNKYIKFNKTKKIILDKAFNLWVFQDDITYKIEGIGNPKYKIKASKKELNIEPTINKIFRDSSNFDDYKYLQKNKYINCKSVVADFAGRLWIRTNCGLYFIQNTTRINVLESNLVSCTDLNDASLKLEFLGGIPPYTYKVYKYNKEKDSLGLELKRLYHNKIQKDSNTLELKELKADTLVIIATDSLKMFYDSLFVYLDNPKPLSATIEFLQCSLDDSHTSYKGTARIFPIGGRVSGSEIYKNDTLSYKYIWLQNKDTINCLSNNKRLYYENGNYLVSKGDFKVQVFDTMGCSIEIDTTMCRSCLMCQNCSKCEGCEECKKDECLIKLPINKNNYKESDVIVSGCFLFEEGKIKLSSIIKEKLDLIALSLKHNKNTRILIIGYACIDSKEREYASKSFAIPRAKAVKEYLMKLGVLESQLEIKGSVINPELDEKSCKYEFKIKIKSL